MGPLYPSSQRYWVLVTLAVWSVDIASTCIHKVPPLDLLYPSPQRHWVLATLAVSSVWVLLVLTFTRSSIRPSISVVTETLGPGYTRREVCVGMSGTGTAGIHVRTRLVRVQRASCGIKNISSTIIIIAIGLFVV